MDDAPSAPAKSYRLFALARPQAARALADDVIDFVCAYRGDGSYLPVTNSITLPRHDVGDQEHGALVVRPRPRCDFFKVRLVLFVFAEKPIHRPIGGDASGGDLAALALRVPLVEQGIQGCGSATIPVLAARGVVVGPQRLIQDGATQPPVESRDVEIEGGSSGGEPLGNDEAGQGLAEHHKSSATSRSRRMASGRIAWSRSSRSHSFLRPSFTLGCGYSFPPRLIKSSTVVSPQ